MYLNLGLSAVVPTEEIVAIFDLDNTTWSHRTRAFLERAEREGRVTAVGDGLPRSFVLCRGGKIYVTQLSAGTLSRREEF